MESKICTNCKAEKPLFLFYRDPRHLDGRHSWCRECHKTGMGRWRDRHPEQVLTTTRASNRRRVAAYGYPASFVDYLAQL